MASIRRQFAVRSKVSGELVKLNIDLFLTRQTTSATVICCKDAPSWSAPAYTHQECCELPDPLEQLVMGYYPSKDDRKALCSRLEEGFDNFTNSELLEHGFLAPIMAENIAKWVRQHRKDERFAETLRSAEESRRWFASTSSAKQGG